MALLRSRSPGWTSSDPRGKASVDLEDADVDDGGARGLLRRRDEELDPALGEDVFDDGEGDVDARPRARK